MKRKSKASRINLIVYRLSNITFDACRYKYTTIYIVNLKIESQDILPFLYIFTSLFLLASIFKINKDCASMFTSYNIKLNSRKQKLFFNFVKL